MRCRPTAGPWGVPLPRHESMAAHASATQPKGSDDVAAGDEARRRLAPAPAHPPPLAKPALRRQAPEVGAGCGNAARPDLCGGALSNGRPYRDCEAQTVGVDWNPEPGLTVSTAAGTGGPVRGLPDHLCTNLEQGANTLSRCATTSCPTDSEPQRLGQFSRISTRSNRQLPSDVDPDLWSGMTCTYAYPNLKSKVSVDACVKCFIVPRILHLYHSIGRSGAYAVEPGLRSRRRDQEQKRASQALETAA